MEHSQKGQQVQNSHSLVAMENSHQQQQQNMLSHHHHHQLPTDVFNSVQSMEHSHDQTQEEVPSVVAAPPPSSRYESQKRRDWNAFGQFLRNLYRPPLPLSRCTAAHVVDFLRYLDQFGKTTVHAPACPFFGLPQPPAPCSCPLRQAWGSLDALIGRLRAAFEEHGGKPESNPFGAHAVRLYLREVREMQAKARGIAYGQKRKRNKPAPPAVPAPAPTPITP